MSVQNAVESLIEKSKTAIPTNDCDYIGEDGLLYCGKCHTKKQTEVMLFGTIRRPMCLCKCEAEKRDKEEAERKQADFGRKIKDLRRTGFPESNMQEWTFENDDMTNSRVTNAMKKYVENFDEMKKQGKGLLLYGNVGTGKALTVDTDIITPYGIKKMKDIHIGDEVIGWNGKPCTVIGEYPQGELETYIITFDDGTKVQCCADHLWIYKTPHSRNKHWRVAPLKEMLKKHNVKCSGGYTMAIPKAEAVEYKTENDLLIPPYALGALLGDGGMSNKQITFTNPENDVCKKVFSELRVFNVVARKHTDVQYLLSSKRGHKNELKAALAYYGLVGCHSVDKFIPKVYLYASIESRKELLAGIFDTDGSIALNGAKSISTTSKQMADDIITLCHSLGYRCSFRKPDTRHDNTCYTIGVQTDKIIYKSDKHKMRDKIKQFKKKKDYMSIVSIEKAEKAECKCIAVDNETKSYLCGDFIVTHNTYAACEVANALIDKGYPVLVTNFARIINALQATFEKQEYIDSFNRFSLLVIDDLGIERNTEFAKEQVFNIIDSRYRAGLPMIITTNLSIDKIKKPDDIENGRIYDRILERCFPIEVSGQSRRRKAIKESYDDMKNLLEL